jgi:hypothetical protein
MYTKPLPEIAESDLAAVRQFLTSQRDERRESRPPRSNLLKGAVPLRLGISRARSRSTPKSEP